MGFIMIAIDKKIEINNKSLKELKDNNKEYIYIYELLCESKQHGEYYVVKKVYEDMVFSGYGKTKEEAEKDAENSEKILMEMMWSI